MCHRITASQSTPVLSGSPPMASGQTSTAAISRRMMFAVVRRLGVIQGRSAVGIRNAIAIGR